MACLQCEQSWARCLQDVFTGSAQEEWTLCTVCEPDVDKPSSLELHAGIVLLQCFLADDSDYDGQVNSEESDMMVEIAAKDVMQVS